jgi:hypothetical protein
LDLAVSNLSSDTVSILLGTGTGSFGPATPFSTGGSQPFGVVVGDFNNNGELDLAVVNEGSSTVSILLGTGTGSFGTPTPFATGGSSPINLAVGILIRCINYHNLLLIYTIEMVLTIIYIYS